VASVDDETPDREAPELRPFAAWLQEHRKGGLHAELSERLAEVAAAVVFHQEAGQLTLTVKLKPNKDGVSMQITDEIKSKVPEPDRGAAIFFADSRGNLSRNDPRQEALPLRGVAGGRSDTTDERTGS